MDIVAFTGAGISAASGIPTFEELGQDFREKLSRWYWRQQPEDFFRAVLMMKDACTAAVPNAAHKALAEYGVPVITMNIDGLHRRAGTTDLIEIHGGMEAVDCSRCGGTYPFEQAREGVYCPGCGGLLDTRVVLYGDGIPRLEEALGRVEGPGTLLVVGTSFYTSTASYVVDHARGCGRRIVMVNRDAEAEVPRLLDQMKREDA